MPTYPTTFEQISQAYKDAPLVGKVRGAINAAPLGLAAGALTYGGLSLIPGIRKRRGLKAALSLLAAVGGGATVFKPFMEQARDQYFMNNTGLPSPWQSYTIDDAGKVSVVPSKVIDVYKKEWDTFKKDPKAYLTQRFKDQYSKLNDPDLQDLENYKKEWADIKADPQRYFTNKFHENYVKQTAQNG